LSKAGGRFPQGFEPGAIKKADDEARYRAGFFAFGIRQSESDQTDKRQDKQDDHDGANEVDNIVHDFTASFGLREETGVSTQLTPSFAFPFRYPCS
jgi:hypothetical protein